MNIAILSTSDIQGGAAKAAFRLHNGLELIGQQSLMAVRRKKSAAPYVFEVQALAPDGASANRFFNVVEKYAFHQNRTPLSNTYFTIPYPGFDLSETEPILHSDVINLHWVAKFQSVESITGLLKLRKPVVWTLHDENAYSGGCHYSAGCRNYESGCVDCPQLNVNDFQLPSHVVNHKRRSWGNDITIVTTSKWLAECASRSLVFGQSRVEVIPNALETDIFRPLDKQETKQKLGVPTDSLCLLFGAEYHSERRKGYWKLKEALDICFKDPVFKRRAQQKKIWVFTFGDPQNQSKEIELQVKSFGYVHSDEKLAEIYSAADLYILPSLEDNLPNTMLEAMACGTPVVSFPVGGMPDMIQNGETGFVAEDMNSESLASAILKALGDHQKRKEMTVHCRRLIEANYTLAHQAKNYLKLFEELHDSRSLRHNSEEFHNFRTRNNRITLRNPRTKINRTFFQTYKQCALSIVKRPDYLNNQNDSEHCFKFTKRLKTIARTQALLFYSHRAGRITTELIKFSKNNLRKIWRKYKSWRKKIKRGPTK
jgi:glycosyltransferase involved in cell wall biosynthesis